jgi:hypothetical protein
MRLMIFGIMALAFVCILVGLWLDNRDEMARRRGFKWWW